MPTAAPCPLIGCKGRWAGSRTCTHNAAMESFFALLQKNVLHRRRWTDREELRLANHRDDLPPPTPPRQTGPPHPNRVRDPPTSRSRGLNAPTEASQPTGFPWPVASSDPLEVEDPRETSWRP